MRRIAALGLVPSVLVLPLANVDIARGAGVARGVEVASSRPHSPTGTPVVAMRTAVKMAQSPMTTGTITVSKNLARQAAERANGGLDNYRSEAAMHGPALDAPYRDGGETWIFTFRGGAPGALDFTVESEVTVNKTTLETIILYNGPLRNTGSESTISQGDGSPDERAVQPPAPPDPVATDPRQTTAPSQVAQDRPSEEPDS